MNTPTANRFLTLLSLLGGGLLLTGCGGGLGDGVKLESIEIRSFASTDDDTTDGILEINQCGLSQLQLYGTWSDGEVALITNRAVWTSSDESVITNVNAPGDFAAIPIGIASSGTGTVTVTASYAGLTQSVPVRVTPGRLEMVNLVPTVLQGSSLQFAVQSVGNGESSTDVSSFVNWTATDLSGSNVVTLYNFDNTERRSPGSITADNVGTARITADLSRLGVDCGSVAQTDVNVADTATLVVEPASLDMATFTAARVAADLLFSDNQRQSLFNRTALTWDLGTANNVRDPGAGGLSIVSTGFAGSSTITANFDDTDTGLMLSDTLDINVTDYSNPRQEALTLDPAGGALALGSTTRLTITGEFGDDGNGNPELTMDLSSSVLIQSSEPGVAGDTNASLVGNLLLAPLLTAAATAPTDATDPTSTTVSASLQITDANGVTQNRATVEQVFTLSTSDVNNLDSGDTLRIEPPANPNPILTGYRVRFDAFVDFAQDSDGVTPLPALVSGTASRQVIWTSSDPSVLQISNNPDSNGFAVAMGPGSTTLTANLGNEKTASITVDVQDPP